MCLAAGLFHLLATGRRLGLGPLGCFRRTPLRLGLLARSLRCSTTLRFHHEKLASVDEREEMRARWRAALAAINELIV